MSTVLQQYLQKCYVSSNRCFGFYNTLIAIFLRFKKIESIIFHDEQNLFKIAGSQFTYLGS